MLSTTIIIVTLDGQVDRQVIESATLCFTKDFNCALFILRITVNTCKQLLLRKSCHSNILFMERCATAIKYTFIYFFHTLGSLQVIYDPEHVVCKICFISIVHILSVNQQSPIIHVNQQTSGYMGNDQHFHVESMFYLFIETAWINNGYYVKTAGYLSSPCWVHPGLETQARAASFTIII